MLPSSAALAVAAVLVLSSARYAAAWPHGAKGQQNNGSSQAAATRHGLRRTMHRLAPAFKTVSSLESKVRRLMQQPEVAAPYVLPDNITIEYRRNACGPDCGLTETTRKLAQALNQKNRSNHIALVNCVPWHYEVEFGFSKLLLDMGYRVTLFTSMDGPRRTYRDWGKAARSETARQMLMEQLGLTSIHPCQTPPAKLHQAIDTVIWLSADDQMQKTMIGKTFMRYLDELQPRRVIGVAHVMREGNMRSLDFFRTNHPRVFMLTMGLPQLHKLQHMHRHNSGRTFDFSTYPMKADWVMPFFTPKASTDCRSVQCHTTFAVQGNLWMHQRNYTGLFADLTASKDLRSTPNFRVKLVGGGNLEFRVPSHLSRVVPVFRELGFEEFFSTIRKSVALVPLLNDQEYLDGTRISSTFIMSLFTNTPLLVDKRLLQLYPYLRSDCVYVREEGETEVDAMRRILAMSKATHNEVRHNMQSMKAELNEHNKGVMRKAIEAPWEDLPEL